MNADHDFQPQRDHLPLRGIMWLVCALWVGLPGAAQAAGPRYTTVFEERIGDAVQGTSAAELEVVRQLTAAGVPFVDEAQSRKIRSVTDAGTLLAGGVSGVITSLDADVIVAGVVKLEQVASDLLGDNAFRYDATIDAKAIAVDTGAVLGTYFAKGKAIGFSHIDAQRKAARDAGGKLADELLAARAAATPRGIELTVAGVPNVTAGERVVQGVRALDAVAAVEVLQAGRGTTKLRVEAPDTTARELALALDAQAGLGVTVFGYSKQAIRADYSPEAATRLSVVITRLEDTTGARAHAWRAPAAAGILATALANKPFVQLHADGTPVSLPRAWKQWARPLKAQKVDRTRALVLTGRIHKDSAASFGVEVQLRSAQTGAALLTGQRSCAKDAMSGCVADLGDALAEKLMPALLAKRHLFKSVVPTRMQAGAGSPQKPLRVAGVTIANIFPARMATYAEGPIGELAVENRGKTPLTDVVVRARLVGFGAAPIDVPAPDIAPGGSATLPVRVLLDRARLLTHDQNATAVVDITVSYRVDELQVEQRRSQAVVVYDRNALSWSEPDSVAAFVTARTDGIQNLARRLVAGADAADQADPMALAARLFAALGELGLGYQRDPVHPFGAEALDTVQFPEQTLARRTGDCDDLAVLYASLAEALGLPTVLVTTPEHVFVASYTGIPVHNRDVMALGDDRLIEYQDMLWLPLETTLVGKPVADAWERAVTTLAGARKVAATSSGEGVGIIDIRSAWARFQPVSLVDPAALVLPEAPAQVGSKLTPAVAAFRAAREGRMASAVAAVDAALSVKPGAPQLLLQKGVLLAVQGQHAAASKLFGSLEGAAEWSRFALNNEGNVALLDGDAPRAYGHYQGALRVDASDARVHINAALAAHLKGDEKAFGNHVFECILLGGDALVDRLSRAGLGDGQGARGAAGGAGSLRAAIQRAYAARKKPLPPTLATTGLRASDAQAATTVAHHVYWLF